jgi:hypothetical protein
MYLLFRRTMINSFRRMPLLLRSETEYAHIGLWPPARSNCPIFELEWASTLELRCHLRFEAHVRAMTLLFLTVPNFR